MRRRTMGKIFSKQRAHQIETTESRWGIRVASAASPARNEEAVLCGRYRQLSNPYLNLGGWDDTFTGEAGRRQTIRPPSETTITSRAISEGQTSGYGSNNGESNCQTPIFSTQSSMPEHLNEVCLRNEITFVQSPAQTEESPTKKGLIAEHERNIKRHFRYLKDQLDADILVDYFHQDGYINDVDLDEITSTPSRRSKTDLLLRKFLRFQQDAYNRFLEILKESGYMYVAEALIKCELPEALREEDITAEDADERIIENYIELRYQLEPIHIVDYFIVYEVFSINEYEKVIAEKTREDKAELLIIHIRRNLPMAYNVLVHALNDTGNVYMFGKLQNTGNRDTTKSAASVNETGPQRVQLESGRVRPSPLAGAEFKLTLTFRNKVTRQNERDIVTALQRPGIRLVVNDAILDETGCLISGVTNGSVIILLQSCGDLSSEKIHRLCKTGNIRTILERILLQPNLMELFPRGSQKFDLVVECNQTAKKPASSKGDIQENLNNNMEFLLEELDAISYVKVLEKKGTLNEEESNCILNVKPVSRQIRTKKMFDILNEKGLSAIESFIEVLKEKKKEYILERLQPRYDERDSTPDVLVHSYSFLVGEMPARAITNECSAQHILDKDYIDRLSLVPSCSKREVMAQFLVQDILLKDKRAQHVFCNILINNRHVPLETGLLTAGNQKKVAGTESPTHPCVGTLRKHGGSNTVFTGKFTLRMKGDKPCRKRFGRKRLIYQEPILAALKRFNRPFKRESTRIKPTIDDTDSGYLCSITARSVESNSSLKSSRKETTIISVISKSTVYESGNDKPAQISEVD